MTPTSSGIGNDQRLARDVWKGVRPSEIEAAVETEMNVRWGPVRRHPQLTAFDHDGVAAEWRNIRMTIELDEHLELPFEIEDAEVLEMVQGGPGGFATTLADVCEGLQAHDASLRTSQDAMRVRCEEFVRELTAGGLDMTLAWLSLAPYDHWVSPAGVTFDIALRGLGENLQPADLIGEAGLRDNLHEAFEHVIDTQRDRALLRSEVRSQPADGIVDDVALAVIRSQPNPAATFAAALIDKRVELPEGMSLYWTEGVLHSRGDCAGGVDWWRDTIELPGRWYSGPAIKALIGEPATAVCDHPALADIPVRAINSRIDDGRASTVVDLQVGTAFFDAETGRCWPRQPPTDG